MACKIPYIQNQAFSESEKLRLEKEHISIFSRAKQSGAFREYDKQLYAKKNDINPSREFIAQINTEYGKPITKMVSVGNGNQVLSVNVLPLSNEQQGGLFLQKLTAEEKAKTIEQVTKEYRSIQGAYDFNASSNSGKWNSANNELLSLVQDNRKAFAIYKFLIGDMETFKEIVDFLNERGIEIPYTDRMKRADETMTVEERKSAIDSYNNSVTSKIGNKVQVEKDILSENNLQDETEYTPQELIGKYPLTGVQKAIWNLIKDIVNKLEIKVKFSSSRITEGFDGSNNPQNGEILIRPSTLKNGRFGEVLVHEVVHALTTKIISRVNSGVTTGLTQKQINAVKGLMKLFEAVKADNNLENKYPVKDVFEFIAHLTNEVFVKELESKNKNFLQKTVDFIFDIIGVNNANDLAKQYLKDIISDGVFLQENGITVLPSDYGSNIQGNKNFQKLSQEELQQTVQEVTKQHRSVAALKDLAAKLAHRIGGKVRFENNPNADWKGYNQGNTSQQVIKLTKELIEKIGVDYRKVTDIVVNGQKVDANGIANIVKGYIEVIDGKESEALPEEAMHFAVEIIEQTNPKLFNKMLSEINDFQIYKDVLRDYSNDPLYQTKEGKPDIRKLKKEAIAKQLVQTIINKVEGTSENYQKIAKVQSWWSQILEWIRNLFVKSGFDKAALDIISGKEIGTIDDIRSGNDIFLQKTTQDNIISKFKEISSQVEKKGEEGYFVNGVKVNRVTDIIKNWLDRRFDERKITNSEYDNALDDLKAETGTKYHNYIEKAGQVFVDQDGNLREEELPDQEYVDSLPVVEAEKYLLLKENLKQRLDSFEPGTKFLFEQIVYDSNRKLAGTIDFIAITPNGEVSILDWKFMSLNTQTYNDVPWYKIDGWNRQMEQYKLIVSKVYGVKNEDFKQTRMIPFRVDYVGGDRRKDILPSPQSIEIGNVNVQDIEEDYLLPVPLRGETTGDKTLDSLLEKLNSVYDSLSQKKVTESEKKGKAEQLNSLFSAIRQLQVKKNLIPLIQQAKILNKGINDILKEYSTKFEGKDPRSFTEDEINDFAHDINVFQEAIENYIELDTELDYLFENKELDEFDKLVKQELEETVKTARKIKIKLANIDKEFADKFVAGYEQVQGSILNPEKIVQWLPKMFSSTSTLQIKTIEVFFKKINRALFFAQKDAITETEQLLDLQKNYEKWATSKNI